MIAVCVSQKAGTLFENVQYNVENPNHRQKLYEYASLQWPIDQQKLLQNIGYFVAVCKGKIIEVFQMDEQRPYVTMRKAVQESIIIQKADGYHVNGFMVRVVGVFEFKPERYFFYKCNIAPSDIRDLWIGHQVRLYGPLGYV